MPNSSIIHLEDNAMGSVFEIFACGTSEASVREAVYRASNLVKQLEAQLSHYLPDSEISLLNQYAYDQVVPVSQNLWELLLRIKDWSEKSDGAFDPTKGKLVKLWGLFRQGQRHATQQGLPSPTQIQTILEGTGWDNVALQASDQTVRFLTPEVALHLGAVGKGYIVQCAADLLRNDVDAALLHSGHSSIVAFGDSPQGEGWQINIATPMAHQKVSPSYTLKDSSLSTSGSSEQTITIGAEKYSHIFDPRTGWLLKDTSTTVVVKTFDAAEGDALATAFLVRGGKWAEEYFCNAENTGILFIMQDSSSPNGVAIHTHGDF